MEFERVLVPLDFSDSSRHALEVALKRFGSPQTTFVLLHVVENAPTPSDDDGMMGDLYARAQDVAHNKLVNLARTAAGCKAVTPVVEYGRSGATIVRAAKAHEVDLVVLGSHGTSSLSKAFFGATTYYVARRIHCSCLIVKLKEE
ncbi:MAG: universal stress protein [Gammaproteobacteria bacterium]|nr:universal stress protein [Gammaproteobacteria bacterium]